MSQNRRFSLASPAMVRRIALVLVLAALSAACGGTAEDTTTTLAPATTAPEAASTTAAPASTTTTEPATTPTTEPATTSTTAGPVVAVVDIAVTGGTVEQVERFEVPLDGTVRVTVTADAPEEIHVHGYDLHTDVAPDTEAVLEFDAVIPGVFEIELEGSGVLIAELQVAP